MPVAREMLVLGALSVGARLAVLPFLPPLRYDALTVAGRWSLEVLRDHLAEYVAFTIYRPPVTYLWDGALVALAGPRGAYEGRAFLIGTFALDVVAVLLLYAAARLLGVARAFAAIVTAVFSLALVPWELWREGAHYDHLTIVVASAFAASATLAVARPSLRSALALGVAGAMYVGQSPAALYAVPAGALAALLLAKRVTAVRRVVLIALALLVPAAVAAPVIARNSAEARSFATGDQGGPAIMLTVHEATKQLADPAAVLFEDGTAPAWYRWCYEHATPPAGTEDDPSWRVLARAFGICFPLTTTDAPTWPFDMTALRAELERTADPATRELIDRDLADMRDRRYLFAGYSPEQSARWIGVYGAVSQRLAFGLFARHPDLTAKALAVSAARYVRYGPFLPARVLRAPSEDGMRTLATAVPFEPAFRVATALFALVALAGVVALPLSAARGLVALWRGRGLDRDRAAIVLAAPAAVVSAVVLLGAWDLDRYFMQVTPYVVLAAAAGAGAIGGGRVRGAARSTLVRILGEPGTRETYSADADVRGLAARRAAVLDRKPRLRLELGRRDAEIHRAFERWAAGVTGPLLEIGAGVSPVGPPAGRRVIHSDTYAEGGVDVLASAGALPFRPGTLAAVVGVHVLHHLTDPVRALKDAFVALRAGGVVVLIEPDHNLLSRIVFGVFHPERFDRSQAGWVREPFPDTEANQAAAWILFERDRERLGRVLPRLRVLESRPIPSLGALLTGGYLLRQLAPDTVIDLVARVTARPPLLGWLSVHRIIVLREVDG